MTYVGKRPYVSSPSLDKVPSFGSVPSQSSSSASPRPLCSPDASPNAPSKTSSQSGASKLLVAGLFAGIGGFELGLKRAGHEATLLCDVDEDSRLVLGAHF